MSFFFAEDTERPKTHAGRKLLTIETLNRLECQACPLDKIKGLLHPKMEPTGSKNPLVLFLGEAPGVEEDREGVQFVGKSGQILRARIPERFRKLIRWNNCVRTRPPGNTTPGVIELECCRPSVARDIEATKPKAIFGFGGIPLKWAIGDEGIYKWRGRYLPVRVGSHTCWFFPMLHPAGLLRRRKKNKRTGAVIKSEDELTFERDLDRAFKLVEKLPKASIDLPQKLDNGLFSGIEFVTGENGWDDVKVVKEQLNCFIEKSSSAFDIETTTKEKMRERQSRPYGEGARILSISVGTKDHSFAFPLHHREAKWTKEQREVVEKIFVEYMQKAKGFKIAHNLAFELEWVGHFYGRHLVRCGKLADTMAQAYVLDERKGMLSLDALILLHFGFHLKALTGVNRTDLANETLENVLIYNALDSMYEHKLYLKQKRLLAEQGLTDVYERIHLTRIPTVVHTQLFGLPVDFDAVLAFDKKFSARLEKVRKWIQKSRTAARFKEVTKREFNPASSGRDVLELFRDILKRPEGWVEIEPGVRKYSADDSALEKIRTPFARKLQEFRALAGNKAKYVDPLHPQQGKCIWPDGYLHPQLHTLFTDTGRTSASFPNEQYWPKRDESYRELRSEFSAPEDCYSVAIDQGQIEARVIEMAAKDRRYGQYLWDRHDIHMEWTERLAHAYPARIGGKKFIKDKVVMKTFRTDVKNQWTFPLFFGANPYSVAEYTRIPVEIIKPLVERFWREFEGVKSWQMKLEKFYQKNGYVECLTGRRRRAPIKYNELINSPIQGSASDITIDAYTRLSIAAQDLDMWQFQARMEIHDELVFFIPKKTFDRDIQFIADHMLECRHFPFINVPLCIEIGRGPNWFKQEHVATLFSDDFGKINRKECGF